MPNYREKLAHAFGKKDIGEYDITLQQEIKLYFGKNLNSNKSYEEIKAQVEKEKLENVRSQIEEYDEKDFLDEEDNKKYNELIEKENYNNEMFKYFKDIKLNDEMDREQRRNGLNLYADVKGRYESLSWFQRLAAHLLPASLSDSAKLLEEKNAYEKILFNEMKLDKDEIKIYTDKVIRENTDLENKFDGVPYSENYEELKVEIESEEYMEFVDGRTIQVNINEEDVEIFNEAQPYINEAGNQAEVIEERLDI